MFLGSLSVLGLPLLDVSKLQLVTVESVSQLRALKAGIQRFQCILEPAFQTNFELELATVQHHLGQTFQSVMAVLVELAIGFELVECVLLALEEYF